MIKNRIIPMILLLVVMMIMTGTALAFEASFNMGMFGKLVEKFSPPEGFEKLTRAFENEPEGFRGLKWGDPPGEEMIKYLSLPPVNYYKLPDESLSLGNVELYQIGYQFLVSPEGEAFMMVGLYFRGEANYDLMKIICKEKFGEEEEEWYQMSWWSPKSFVTLKYDLVEEKGSLGITSVPLLREMTKAIEKLESEKAKKDW